MHHKKCPSILSLYRYEGFPLSESGNKCFFDHIGSFQKPSGSLPKLSVFARCSPLERFITTNIVGTSFTNNDFITSCSNSVVLQRITTSFFVCDSTHPKIFSYVAIGARFEHTNKVFLLFRSS